MLRRRAVVVHRRTELDELLDRHGTRGQAEFFLRSRGRTLAEVQARHDTLAEARAAVAAAVPDDWARADVERADLSRFLVDPEDVVVVVGQDGLVANVAKYLHGQPVLGVDPEPGVNAGVLVRHPVAAATQVLRGLGDPAAALSLEESLEDLTMVRADLDDGQHLTALNEVFVGHPSHQSARYALRCAAGEERQSSSGLLVSTGTGATGWWASLAHDRGGRPAPARTDVRLGWFVREAWPSPTTGVALTEGYVEPGAALAVTVASDRLVVFGDGIEDDRLVASWGQTVTVRTADAPLRLVRP
ncbi:NAD(+)/NADH kinase [Cellulosimicrobium terreum]|nr:NAD(+)/NADH kinase [Cellulosimicrobium terreum]